MSAGIDWLIRIVLVAAVYYVAAYQPDGLINTDSAIEALGRYGEDVLDGINDGQRVGT